MNNFWQKLKKPILALAPMAGITDAAFRYLCQEYGADVLYSEMVSSTALCYESKKTLRLMRSYKRNKKSKFVVQLFGNNPEHFAQAVKIIEKKIKPDGIDINFGCPVGKIQRSGSGAALFQNLKLSREVIKATIGATKLPVSIKTRISAGKITIFDFLENIKDLPVAAIMTHGRTLAQGFSGEIDFEAIKKIKKIFKGVVLANGNIYSLKDAQETLAKTGADGLGIGQAVMGRPWIFKQLRITLPTGRQENYELKINEKFIFKVILRHAKLAHKLDGDVGMLEMRKHLCWYVKGVPGAAELRKKFVKINSLADIKKLLK